VCIGRIVATVTRRLSWLVVVVLLAQSGTLAAEDVATVSFSAGSVGTYPASIKGGKIIEVDLSALPGECAIIRAVLRPGRDQQEAGQDRLKAVKVVLRGREEAIPLLAPRFTSFDATGAVRQARAGGRDKIAFDVVSLSGYRPEDTRLDVTCTARAAKDLPRVQSLRARHRSGQTILTWSEVDPPTAAAELTWKDWKDLQAKLARQASPIRYRVYRGSEPITSATIARAEMIDEMGSLTCWNRDYSGEGAKDDDKLRRYVVDDGGQPVAPGTGIYAHNPKVAGRVYYAVSVAVNGEESLSAFDAGNSTREAIEETVGLGEPILQRIERPKSFNYVDGPTLHYYVRWESWPNCNLPSSAYDYLVAMPANMKEPAPVGLHLHCWGGSLDGGYGWWYGAGAGAMLISTNQIPYDWWTGYHENRGTWKPWSEGVVHDFTQARILSFLDWAAGRWKIDRQRAFTAGSSMGGSGSPNLGIRHADRIAWVVSWVGVHTPSRSAQFKGSYEQVYGNVEWKLAFADGKTPAFSYFDDEWFLRQNPAAAMPLICFSNGKNDGAIGWPQARDFWIALQETRRPHVFVWGQSGHGQRALLPGPKNGERELGVDVRVDRTLPAFTHCSLDENPGSGDPDDGDPKGQSNLYLYWESADEAIIDRPGTWSMVLRLNDSAPKEPCTVDVTPRRCQQFKAPVGRALTWRNVSMPDGRTIQEGQIKADEWGLATVPGVLVGKKGNRLTIAVPAKAESVPGPAARTAPQEPRSSQPPKPLAGLRADGKGAPVSDVFGLTRVHRLHLALSGKEWEAMQNTKGGMAPGIPGGADRTAAEKQQGQRDIHLTDFIEYSWAHADLTEDGQTYRNVGVRYKGNFTYMASMRQLKRPMKIEFDHYDKDAPRFHGLRKFNLHASVLDPTKIHEVLSLADGWDP